MRWLFVMAHPDDEADVGGTIYRLTQSGHQVAVAIMVGKVMARRNKSESLEDDEQKSMNLLGVSKVFHADFPNIKMNTVPHCDLVQFIAACIDGWKPEAVVTHHAADVNIDHSVTSVAVMSAIHSLQFSLRLVLLCETAGATEWALDSSKNRIKPNYFVEIGRHGLEVKKRAHSSYTGVPRPYPHPYSKETYEGLAAFRGAQAGCEFAEAFECLLRSD